MWHVETDYFAMAVFIIMLIKEHSLKKEYPDVQTKTFYWVLIVSIVNAVIDIAASIAMNDIKNWWVYQILMTIDVISMPLLAAVWVQYTYVLIHRDEDVKRLQRAGLYLLIPYTAYTLLAVTNPFTGLFFHLTDDIEYTRGILFLPVGVGSIMLYSVIGLILVLCNWKKIRTRHTAVLLVTFFVTTVCIICIQLAHPGWLIINASYAVIYVWCDITIEDQRRKALYQQINRKNEELEVIAKKAESAAHAKTEFLSRMSHDIRTPMNAIIGLTHLAREEKDLTVIQEYLQNIESASDFLLGLINDILDMSKIENGDLTLKEDSFSREEFINSINTVIKPLMNKRNLTFIFEMPESIDCIRVDRLRFSQVFFNLLSNAAKFTPTGGTVEFTAEVLPEKKDQKVGLRFYIKDNGIGISEEFLPHLYDPFSQERTEMGDKVKGTGLGLPIVKSLVDIMGGPIDVHSCLGKGTEFIVEMYVPLADTDVQADGTQVSLDVLRNVKVLLVEDNEINTYVAQILLEKVGCEVVIAKNGKEAVDQFAASVIGDIKAILMDVRMPIMDGLEATRHIRAMERADAARIPIIAMTAEAFDEERQKTINAGMNYHLSKPINPDLLYQVLVEQLQAGAQE